MKAMNFYTSNGWSGSNYDSKLSTKEISAKVRSFAKKNFPAFKFSVRSEWSMSTDSMYIELKAGTCVPFVEGSRSKERGYMSTMSTVKGWENELTPEMFSVLDAISTYANSFRYDDSDGMQDYYDTNFYLRIKVSDEYQVIEQKENKNTSKTEKEVISNVLEPVTVEGLEIVDYSEKAIAVFGDTKAVKDQLKELGGRFNPSLNYNGEKRAGWIFSKKQADNVKELIKATELPALPEEIYIPELQKIPEKVAPNTSNENTKISHKKHGKSLQDIIDQTRRLNGYSGRNWYWSFKREKLINKIYSYYVANIQKLGAFSDPEKKFTKEEYTGITRDSENIHFTKTNNFNGVCYYDIEGAGIITSAKVRADIQPGDVFNVYTDKERKYGVTYDGVSVKSSLNNDLPGIIEFNGKIESGTLSASSHYTPMDENVEFYEKKVKGKRYTVKDKPLTLGYYGVYDNLDNCMIDCYPAKEEAKAYTEYLNARVDRNGRLKNVI